MYIGLSATIGRLREVTCSDRPITPPPTPHELAGLQAPFVVRLPFRTWTVVRLPPASTSVLTGCKPVSVK